MELDKDVKTYRNIQNGRASPVLTAASEAEKGKDDSVASYKREQMKYRVYPWRWFMLLGVCLLNVSNGMV